MSSSYINIDPIQYIQDRAGIEEMHAHILGASFVLSVHQLPHRETEVRAHFQTESGDMPDAQTQIRLLEVSLRAIRALIDEVLDPSPEANPSSGCTRS